VDVSECSDLLVAEGIETTLAAAELTGWRYPAWAAISAPGLLALDVPRHFKRVIIAADNDEVGTEAARGLAHRLQKRGLRVVIKAPPSAGEDWNDHLLTQQPAARQERAT
jgi:putative DNA primase/helicase